MKKKTIILLLLIASVVAGLFVYFGNQFAPGSYPYAEIYEFDVSVKELISAVEELKRQDSSLVVPRDIGLFDGRRSQNDLWYHFYFYDSEKKRIIKTWVTRTDAKHSNLAFVAVSMDRELGVWSMINRDLPSRLNDMEKEKFEGRILNPISVILKKIEIVGNARD
jgi:hypothetical protein